MVATFTRGSKTGPTTLTATLMVEEDGVLQSSLTAQIALLVLSETRTIFLPQVIR